MTTHRTKQLVAVYGRMRSGAWLTLQELSDHLGRLKIPNLLTGVSARVRDLRKDQYGRHRIDVRIRKGTRLYEYRMRDNP